MYVCTMCKCPVIAIVKIYTEAYKGTYKLCTPHILDLADFFFVLFLIYWLKNPFAYKDGQSQKKLSLYPILNVQRNKSKCFILRGIVSVIVWARWTLDSCLQLVHKYSNALLLLFVCITFIVVMIYLYLLLGFKIYFLVLLEIMKRKKACKMFWDNMIVENQSKNLILFIKFRTAIFFNKFYLMF